MEVLFSNPSASLSRTSPPAPAPTETLYPDPLPRQAEEAAMPDAAAIAAPVGTTALGPYVARHAAQGAVAAWCRSTPRHARSDTPAQGTGPEVAHTDGVFEMSYTLDQVLQGYSKEGRHREQSTGLRERAVDWYEAAATLMPALRIRTVRYVGVTATVALLATPLASANRHEAPKVEAAKPPVAEAPAVVENSEVAKPVPPKKATPKSRPKIDIDPSKYNSRQRILEPNYGTYIDIPGGKPVRSTKALDAKRLKMIEKNLNLVTPTEQEYKEFVADNFTDLSKTIPKIMSNYDGRKNGLGAPRTPWRQSVKHWIWHYTATKYKPTYYDGKKFAGTMQNSGPLAINANISKKGGTYWLSNWFTHHIKGYNGRTMGVEVAATEQADVQPQQYENGIYLSRWFMEKGEIINRKQPVAGTVKRVVKGHHELNPYGHNDFGAMVMDPLRKLTVDHLVNDGGYRR